MLEITKKTISETLSRLNEARATDPEKYAFPIELLKILRECVGKDEAFLRNHK